MTNPFEHLTDEDWAIAAEFERALAADWDVTIADGWDDE
jgi:hypothetical protein